MLASKHLDFEKSSGFYGPFNLKQKHQTISINGTDLYKTNTKHVELTFAVVVL